MARPVSPAAVPRGGAGTTVMAPAKVTLSLHVVGGRADGLHEIEAEMVTVDLADRLEIDPGGHGLVLEGGREALGVPGGPANLVLRALVLAGRQARVVLRKVVPAGGGLGGGSSDAAAVLRWAGIDDPAIALSLGSDVPFCLVGGRAMVRGLGEQVEPLPYRAMTLVLLLPPLTVSTAAVYHRWDERSLPGPLGQGVGGARNDLTEAALDEEPRLASWRDAFAGATGVEPTLAGSGSTWWAEGSLEELGVGGHEWLQVGDQRARLIEVQTVPAGWSGGGC